MDLKSILGRRGQVRLDHDRVGTGLRWGHALRLELVNEMILETSSGRKAALFGRPGSHAVRAPEEQLGSAQSLQYVLDRHYRIQVCFLTSDINRHGDRSHLSNIFWGARAGG